MSFLAKVKIRFPTPLFFVLMLISAAGVLNIASAARAIRPSLYLYQLVWLSIALCICGLIAAMPPRTIRFVAYPMYLFSCGLLVLVLGIGVVVKGSQRWLDIGFFRLQPSELAKIGIVLAIARFCADYPKEKGYSLLELLRPLNISRPLGFFAALFLIAFNAKLKNMVPVLKDVVGWQWTFLLVACGLFGLFWLFFALRKLFVREWTLETWVCLGDMVLVPLALILVQPDLGTSMIAAAIAVSIILFAGVRRRSFLITLCAMVGIVIVAWNFVLHDYQRDRVRTFLNPEADLRGDGYHAFQSMVAIGSGQVLGKGFLGGTQTQLSFLPENHTDFAFAVWAEEWGFMGATFLLALFAIALALMLQIGMSTRDLFEQYLVVGATSVVFWHMLVNVGMVMGLLPVVGVPLPFVSYGGASLIVQFSAVGLCIHASLWRQLK